MPAAALRAAVLALAVLVSWQGVEKYDRKYEKEPWDRAVETVAREIRPADVVLVMPPYALPMVQYYAGRIGTRLPIVPVPIPTVPFDQDQRLAPETIGEPARVTPEGLEQVRRRLDGVEGVWLVYRRSADLAASNDSVLEYLRTTRPQLRAERLLEQILWLYHFGPPAPASGTGAA